MGTKILITEDYEAHGRGNSEHSLRDTFDALLTIEIRDGKVRVIKNMLGSFKGEVKFGLLDLDEGPCGYKRRVTGESSQT